MHKRHHHINSYHIYPIFGHCPGRGRRGNGAGVAQHGAALCGREPGRPGSGARQAEGHGGHPPNEGGRAPRRNLVTSTGMVDDVFI